MHHSPAFLFLEISLQLAVYLCRQCGKTYNLYSGTVFVHRQFRAPQVVLLLRGIFQGQSSAQLARELQMSRTTISYGAASDSASSRRAVTRDTVAGHVD